MVSCDGRDEAVNGREGGDRPPPSQILYERMFVDPTFAEQAFEDHLTSNKL